MFQCRTRHYVCRDSRFAVNAARGIMCVGTQRIAQEQQQEEGFNAARGIMCVGTASRRTARWAVEVSMPHAALCVSGLHSSASAAKWAIKFQCRTRHYVCRDETTRLVVYMRNSFQCRTRHYVCRDDCVSVPKLQNPGVSMPHAALCVSGHHQSSGVVVSPFVSMPHAALCVSGLPKVVGIGDDGKFQCRTRHYVCRD